MTTCTRDGWNVGSETRYHPRRQVTLSAFRGFSPAGKPRYGEYHGREFATTEDASRFACEYGYTSEYHGRPDCFIYCRLTPRCRQYVKDNQLDDAQTLTFIVRVCKEFSAYTSAVLAATYMAETRQRWLDAARK